MIETIGLYTGLLIVFFLIGIPVAFSILLASLVLFFISTGGAIDPAILMQRMVSGLDSFPLLAIPLFILAGNLMNTGGVTRRIFAFANAVVGHMRLGLAQVNIVTSMIFSGMSGSATVDAAALGKVEIRAMLDAGYDRDYSAAVTAASSTVGPIVPPSIPLVIFGIVSGASIGRLLFAGILPGLLIGLGLMTVVAIRGIRLRYTRGTFIGWRPLGRTFRQGFFPLLTPVILLGGIMTGVFTATEAAAVATLYTAFLGIVVYREIDAKRFWAMCKDTVFWTAEIMLIIAAANVFAYMVVLDQIPQRLALAVASTELPRWIFLLVLNLALLVVGCFMETVAAITIMVPVLMPLVTHYGIDPIHFGVIVVLNLVLGLLTPPVGMVIFVTSKIAEVPVPRLLRSLGGFYPPLVIVLLLVTFFPRLVTWLPYFFIGR